MDVAELAQLADWGNLNGGEVFSIQQGSIDFVDRAAGSL
jgi:hypothetical protein